MATEPNDVPAICPHCSAPITKRVPKHLDEDRSFVGGYVQYDCGIQYWYEDSKPFWTDQPARCRRTELTATCDRSRKENAGLKRLIEGQGFFYPVNPNNLFIGYLAPNQWMVCDPTLKIKIDEKFATPVDALAAIDRITASAKGDAANAAN